MVWWVGIVGGLQRTEGIANHQPTNEPTNKQAKTSKQANKQKNKYSKKKLSGGPRWKNQQLKMNKQPRLANTQWKRRRGTSSQCSLVAYPPQVLWLGLALKQHQAPKKATTKIQATTSRYLRVPVWALLSFCCVLGCASPRVTRLQPWLRPKQLWSRYACGSISTISKLNSSLSNRCTISLILWLWTKEVQGAVTHQPYKGIYGISFIILVGHPPTCIKKLFVGYITCYDQICQCVVLLWLSTRFGLVALEATARGLSQKRSPSQSPR